LQRRSSANILTAWPGRVAQAPRAGRVRAPGSCSPCCAPVSRTARFRDQLQLDDEVNSQIADGSDLGTCRPQVTSVGDLPTSSVSAAQLIPGTLGSGPTPPVCANAAHSHTHTHGKRDGLPTGHCLVTAISQPVRLYPVRLRGKFALRPFGGAWALARRPAALSLSLSVYRAADGTVACVAQASCHPRARTKEQASRTPPLLRALRVSQGA
jgi:hypothetical protein